MSAKEPARTALPIPWLTLGCSLALVLVYALQLALASPYPELLLVRLGANAPDLVWRGELYRLATGNLLHATLPHLAWNAIALMVIGAYLEPLLGATRHATLLAGSALAGSLASAWLSPYGLSIGASTAVAGLIGAMLLLVLRRRRELPRGWPLPAGLALFVVAMELLLRGPANADTAAHLGGGLAGAGVAALALRGATLDRLAADASRGWRTAALVLAAVFALSVAAAVARSGNRGSLHAWADARLARSDVSVLDHNNQAYWLATEPDAPGALLDRARDRVRELAEQQPELAGLHDTLAALHYRLGDLDAAVESARLGVALGENPFLAARLARFEAERLVRDGTLRLGAGSDLRLALRIEDDALIVEVAPAAAAPALVHALLFDGDDLRASLELLLDARVRRIRIEDPALAELAAFRIEPSLIDTSAAEQAAGLRIHPYDPRAWDLPPLPTP